MQFTATKPKNVESRFNCTLGPKKSHPHRKYRKALEDYTDGVPDESYRWFYEKGLGMLQDMQRLDEIYAGTAAVEEGADWREIPWVPREAPSDTS